MNRKLLARLIASIGLIIAFALAGGAPSDFGVHGPGTTVEVGP